MNDCHVLFVPEPPSPCAVVTKVCGALGCAVVTDPHAVCHLAIAWDTNTYRQPIPALDRLAAEVDVWNLRCFDIGKPRVDEAFREAFGYSSLVDPLAHHGTCVTKSNLNAAHDGEIVEAPVVERDAERIYQRLIRNELADGTVEDIRTPIFGGEIPFVYLQFRPVESRFDQFDTRVLVEETSTVFTKDEQARIARLARALALDYGELDVLRDREDGRLYVVDANPTPYGPPGRLTLRDQRDAIDRLAAAFDRFRHRGHHWSSRRERQAASDSTTREIVRPTGSSLPPLSVIVVARNEGALVRATIGQLCDTLPPPNEIVVVDDGSNDGSVDGLEETHPRIQLIRSDGRGVAHGRNLGASRSTGRVIVFADAHLSIPAGWWAPLVDAVNDRGVGGAAPAITNLERPWQKGYGLRFSGFDLDVEWLPRLGNEPYNVPLMPWCFGAMRRDVFEATGGFDAGMIQWGSIDNEMSVRLWSLGYELKIVPDIEVGHLFRDDRPYPIAWMPVVHNRLRLAFVHFNADRIGAVVRALATQPDFDAAIARAVTGDASARRTDIASRRLCDTEWLFKDIERERDYV